MVNKCFIYLHENYNSNKNNDWFALYIYTS